MKIRIKVTKFADGEELFHVQLKRSWLKPWVTLRLDGLSAEAAAFRCTQKPGSEEFAHAWIECLLEQEAERRADALSAKVVSVRYMEDVV
ncbi:hypothetical protein D3C85_1029390 [compost metagenome]